MAGYYVVNLSAFAFDTEDEAVTFREALEDAFCSMPESKEYGCSTSIEFEDATISGLTLHS